MSVRVTPTDKWGAELVSRINRTSIGGVVSRALHDHIDQEIPRLLHPSSSEIVQEFGWALLDAVENGYAQTYERVAQIAAIAPGLLTQQERGALQLLTELGLFPSEPTLEKSLRSDAGDTHTYLAFDYDPIVMRYVWDAATADSPDLEQIVALGKKAKSLKDGT